MTEKHRRILLADKLRHQALADSCTEPRIKADHEEIAEALAAAIEEGEVCQCRSETRCVSFRKVSAASRQKRRSRARKTRRRGR